MFLQQDPLFRDLESTFALQQKIVESSKRIVSEGDLYKTLKSKRRYDYMNAGRNQEEKPGNGLKITKGRKPSQVVSLMSTGKLLTRKKVCWFTTIQTFGYG